MDLVGGRLSDCAWLKASLPSSRLGNNIRRASLHVPAAYIAFLSQSKFMVAEILGNASQTCKHLAAGIFLLAKSAGRLDWVSLEEIDVPLRYSSMRALMMLLSKNS